MMALLPIPDRGCRLALCPSRSPPVGSRNSDLLLLLSAKAQLSRGEQTVDDQYIFVGAIVDEFGLAILADEEQRRHFSLGNAGRELDIDLAAVIVGIDWTPWRAVTLDHVTVSSLLHFRNDWSWWQSSGTAGSVFRIEPGYRRHVRLFTGAQLNQIGSPIGVDDKVGLDGGPRRLDHDVDAPGVAVAALGVADDPAHGVAGGERPRSC